MEGKSIINSYIFMGCKHCGKTTQGKKYANYINADFYDLDEEIEKKCGMSVREYFNKYGKDNFFEKEVEAIEDLSYCFEKEDMTKGVVISTGGGICDNDEAMAVIQGIKLALCGNAKEKITLVYLRLDTQYSVDRIVENITEVEKGVFTGVPAYIKDAKGNVPSTMNEIKDLLTKKFNDRAKKYEHYADIIVDIKNAPIDDNFNTILGALK